MWDSLIKNIGVLVAVATRVGSAIAFFVQRADEIEDRKLQTAVNDRQAKAHERESKRTYLEKQAEIYFEVVPLVSKLANAESAEVIEKGDERRFWQIFWGEIGMVEDTGVAQAMDLFGKSLDAFQGRIDNEKCAKKKRAISITLSHCVRKSLGDSWGVQLQDETLNWCAEERLRNLRLTCPMPEGEDGVTDSKSSRTSRSSGSVRAN
jgi:hypothetical protein